MSYFRKTNYGTYTPTGTAGTNSSGITPSVAQWLRVGNVVTVSGSVLITTTGAGISDFEISTPVATTWTGSSQAGGVATTGTGTYAFSYIQSVNANKVQFLANTTAASVYVFSYQYTYLIVN